MAKGDSIIGSIFKFMALLGGAWLTIEVLKAISKKVTYYDCPKCGSDIEYGQENCNVCGVGLDWENSKIEANAENTN